MREPRPLRQRKNADLIQFCRKAEIARCERGVGETEHDALSRLQSSIEVDDDPCGTAERKSGITNSLYKSKGKWHEYICSTTFTKHSVPSVNRSPSRNRRSTWLDSKTGEAGGSVIGQRTAGDESRQGKAVCTLANSFAASSPASGRTPTVRSNFSHKAAASISAGGVLVPDELAADFIDHARAKMVCLRAGARTIPMISDNLTIARVTTDPVFVVKGENTQFPGSSVGFDAIGLFPLVIGNYIPVSRELMEDAPNASDLLQSVLTKSLAVAIDSLAINGNTSAKPDGLLERSDITATGSVGTLAWSHLQTAATAIRNSNIEPTSYFVSPTRQNTLASQVTGDGVNSSKTWLPAPSNVADLAQFSTTTMPDTTIIVGDFTELLFGVRTEAQNRNEQRSRHGVRGSPSLD